MNRARPDDDGSSSGRREYSPSGKLLVDAISVGDKPILPKSLLDRFKGVISRDEVYFLLKEYTSRGYLQQIEDGYVFVPEPLSGRPDASSG